MSIKFKVNNKNAISDIINSHTFNAKCPNCNNPVSYKGNQVGSQITCPFCQKIIQLQDDNFSNKVKEMNNSFNKLFK